MKIVEEVMRWKRSHAIAGHSQGTFRDLIGLDRCGLWLSPCLKCVGHGAMLSRLKSDDVSTFSLLQWGSAAPSEYGLEVKA